MRDQLFEARIQITLRALSVFFDESSQFLALAASYVKVFVDVFLFEYLVILEKRLPTGE